MLKTLAATAAIAAKRQPPTAPPKQTRHVIEGRA
jgi:hypothetical protein